MTRKYWVDKKRLKDPIYWFMKAITYHSTVLFIKEEFDKIKSLDAKPYIFNASLATPYLTGLASELYMKGYLVFKGKKPDKLRGKKIGHNLKILRKMCFRYGDQRFEEDSLIFVTDTLGEHLMEDGGIRYPDKHDMPPIYYNEFEKALNILREISSEASLQIQYKS
ncbi:TPA: hypothetical protein DD690_00415 [Candidatus Daviesbacteria bacterium]|uniref:HEPN domain-containing protein n=1 Tax=Candidatus Daviesbacteria bacterium GW2011_GWF2_38_6 TaxID=1618432 RepID=A0A0G0NP37_9BACT|nr:MAG: hypothetical protein US99_C0009G0002 [Candidatus Daviesbacteria bacterium GW2011_GWF2_38_6]OGE27095.1 MAG: hypothetical protein A2772_01550 [Candidatus Daviesbacteria bacterium RIFCSPHIGHO2_01_FULL_38_8b]OGE44701.1 MAG: hypothetical protein A3E67_04365 [Candidatus Daviesbacteria bacterium RIFCSPHIGHO2_12_FULL_38_25]OGE68914.1 MAG: hypothetical protein A3H81_05250 [Candidatus Daviesbacteria bacterium RIFCSPLOWO2_02_FULL_38_18]OGE73423.1 MAG: hypothetical protein A3H18_02560 [Candidatus D